jgi:outer membrane immunogenic protein
MKTRIFLLAIVTALFLSASAAWAQVEMPSQAGVQFSGVFTKDSNGDGITNNVTRSGGVMVNYVYMFHRWAGVEGDYGWTRNTHNYFLPFSSSGVQANIHEFMGTFVVRPGLRVARVRPYVLAGAAALRFAPTDDVGNVPGVLSQTKPAFAYGGGADFDLTHNFGIRADYHGLVSKVPDFKLSDLTLGTTTHIAQPSFGIFFRF